MLIKSDKKVYGRLNSFLNQSQGAAALEASIILPVIILMLLAFCIFSMYLYEKLVLIDAAVYSARQAAASWDNSNKDLETGGLYGSNQNDGLYWRIWRDLDNSELVKAKTARTNGLIKERIEGGLMDYDRPPEILVSYDNDLVKRTVFVDIKEKVRLPFSWLRSLLPASIGTRVGAEVVEPVEFVRNIDLTAEYLAEAKSLLQRYDGEAPEEAKRRSVLASVESSVNGNKVYHYPGCRYIRRIKNDNLIEFGSEQEANAEGFHICVECAKVRMRRQ